jgi:hypothetical protein
MIKKKILEKINMGIKNAEFDADFASAEKTAKKSHGKNGINEKVTEKLSF